MIPSNEEAFHLLYCNECVVLAPPVLSLNKILLLSCLSNTKFLAIILLLALTSPEELILNNLLCVLVPLYKENKSPSSLCIDNLALV